MSARNKERHGIGYLLVKLKRRGLMKRKIKFIAALTAIAVVAGSLSGCGQKASEGGSSQGGTAEKQVLLASHPFNATHPWQIGLEHLGELLEERTDGRYTVEAHPAGSLSGGSNRSIVEMTGTGALQIMVHSGLSYQGFNEKYAVFALPFMFPDRETGFKVMKESEIAQEAKTWLEPNGCIAFSVVENGMRFLTNSKRKVEKPEDIKGLKIRIPEAQALVSTFRLWGADPTILNMAEVYTAIQQGTVDGQENPVAAIDSNKLYEVCPYITSWTYCWDPAWIMWNKDLIEGLSPEDKEIFIKASEDAADYINNLIAENDEILIKKFEDYGCEVTKLTPDQQQVFKDAAMDVYEQYRGIIGADLVDGMIKAVEDASK